MINVLFPNLRVAWAIRVDSQGELAMEALRFDVKIENEGSYLSQKNENELEKEVKEFVDLCMMEIKRKEIENEICLERETKRKRTL